MVQKACILAVFRLKNAGIVETHAVSRQKRKHGGSMAKGV